MYRGSDKILIQDRARKEAEEEGEVEEESFNLCLLQFYICRLAAR